MNMTHTPTASATTADLIRAVPNIRATAARFRITRLLEGERAAISRAGAGMAVLIGHYHQLAAREAKQARQVSRTARRTPGVHRSSLRAARRQEAAAHPCDYSRLPR